MENISNNNSEISKKKIKLDFKDSKYATGRRKNQLPGMSKRSGNIYVNGYFKDYFKRPTHQLLVYVHLRFLKFQPLMTLNGGMGMSGQAGATILGISEH